MPGWNCGFHEREIWFGLLVVAPAGIQLVGRRRGGWQCGFYGGALIAVRSGPGSTPPSQEYVSSINIIIGFIVTIQNKDQIGLERSESLVLILYYPLFVAFVFVVVWFTCLWWVALTCIDHAEIIWSQYCGLSENVKKLHPAGLIVAHHSYMSSCWSWQNSFCDNPFSPLTQTQEEGEKSSP